MCNERQARKAGLDCKVGFVSGDDILEKFKSSLSNGITHLDNDNYAEFLTAETKGFLENPADFKIISAHAYIGARGVKRALDLGCDIVICEFTVISHLPTSRSLMTGT